MSEPAGIWVARSAWPEVEARLREGAIAVLPIGAGAKEHGYHLPLDTDFTQVEWLARALVERLPVVVWPTLSYGYYPVFVQYPGSISLTQSTFAALAREIVTGILQTGARHVALLNTGISTIEPLRAALAGVEAGRVTLINVYSGPAFTAAVETVEEQAFGGHADEIETSIMLAIAPERVDMSRAVAADKHIERGMFNRLDSKGPNYSPSGVNGDATLATRAKGERLLAAMLDDVLAIMATLA
jgi:creatinine amidohydrolase